jgi:hypothetical protein
MRSTAPLPKTAVDLYNEAHSNYKTRLEQLIAFYDDECKEVEQQSIQDEYEPFATFQKLLEEEFPALTKKKSVEKNKIMQLEIAIRLMDQLIELQKASLANKVAAEDYYKKSRDVWLEGVILAQHLFNQSITPIFSQAIDSYNNYSLRERNYPLYIKTNLDGFSVALTAATNVLTKPGLDSIKALEKATAHMQALMTEKTGNRLFIGLLGACDILLGLVTAALALSLVLLPGGFIPAIVLLTLCAVEIAVGINYISMACSSPKAPVLTEPQKALATSQNTTVSKLGLFAQKAKESAPLAAAKARLTSPTA